MARLIVSRGPDGSAAERAQGVSGGGAGGGTPGRAGRAAGGVGKISQTPEADPSIEVDTAGRDRLAVGHELDVHHSVSTSFRSGTHLLARPGPTHRTGMTLHPCLGGAKVLTEELSPGAPAAAAPGSESGVRGAVTRPFGRRAGRPARGINRPWASRRGRPRGSARRRPRSSSGRCHAGSRAGGARAAELRRSRPVSSRAAP